MYIMTYTHQPTFKNPGAIAHTDCHTTAAVIIRSSRYKLYETTYMMTIYRRPKVKLAFLSASCTYIYTYAILRTSTYNLYGYHTFRMCTYARRYYSVWMKNLPPLSVQLVCMYYTLHEIRDYFLSAHFSPIIQEGAFSHNKQHNGSLIISRVNTYTYVRI